MRPYLCFVKGGLECDRLKEITMFADKYAKSIDYLLENGRDVIQYRLHKEILHDLTESEEEKLLEKVRQTPDYQLLLTHVKPNGYIGTGMHSWEKFKTSHLDDGEAAARLMHNYAIPKETPIIKDFVRSLRDDKVLEEEFSYYAPEKVRFDTRSLGINSGSTLDVIICTCQALLGYGDDREMKHFVDASYNAFESLLNYENPDEITTYNPNLKRKYNFPAIDPDTYFPCQYHLETLANTQSWRTKEKINRLAEAIDHHDRITKNWGGFAVKLNGKQIGPLWAYMTPFLPLYFPQNAPNQRRTLTALAKVCGDKTKVVRESVETLKEMLSDDGVLRTTFESSYQKSRFKDNLRSAHPYAEIGLEPDHKKDTAVWCELTFWAVEFLNIIENNNR